ncbi:hypothetical protein VPH35_122935 [Triticum aestivum]
MGPDHPQTSIKHHHFLIWAPYLFISRPSDCDRRDEVAPNLNPSTINNDPTLNLRRVVPSFPHPPPPHSRIHLRILPDPIQQPPRSANQPTTALHFSSSIQSSRPRSKFFSASTRAASSLLLIPEGLSRASPQATLVIRGQRCSFSSSAASGARAPSSTPMSEREELAARARACSQVPWRPPEVLPCVPPLVLIALLLHRSITGLAAPPAAGKGPKQILVAARPPAASHCCRNLTSAALSCSRPDPAGRAPSPPLAPQVPGRCCSASYRAEDRACNPLPHSFVPSVR